MISFSSFIFCTRNYTCCDTTDFMASVYIGLDREFHGMPRYVFAHFISRFLIRTSPRLETEQRENVVVYSVSKSPCAWVHQLIYTNYVHQ